MSSPPEKKRPNTEGSERTDDDNESTLKTSLLEKLFGHPNFSQLEKVIKEKGVRSSVDKEIDLASIVDIANVLKSSQHSDRKAGEAILSHFSNWCRSAEVDVKIRMKTKLAEMDILSINNIRDNISKDISQGRRHSYIPVATKTQSRDVNKYENLIVRDQVKPEETRYYAGKENKSCKERVLSNSRKTERNREKTENPSPIKSASRIPRPRQTKGRRDQSGKVSCAVSEEFELSFKTNSQSVNILILEHPCLGKSTDVAKQDMNDKNQYTVEENIAVRTDSVDPSSRYVTDKKSKGDNIIKCNGVDNFRCSAKSVGNAMKYEVVDTTTSSKFKIVRNSDCGRHRSSPMDERAKSSLSINSDDKKMVDTATAPERDTRSTQPKKTNTEKNKIRRPSHKCQKTHRNPDNFSANNETLRKSNRSATKGPRNTSIETNVISDSEPGHTTAKAVVTRGVATELSRISLQEQNCKDCASKRKVTRETRGKRSPNKKINLESCATKMADTPTVRSKREGKRKNCVIGERLKVQSSQVQGQDHKLLTDRKNDDIILPPIGSKNSQPRMQNAKVKEYLKEELQPESIKLPYVDNKPLTKPTPLERKAKTTDLLRVPRLTDRMAYTMSLKKSKVETQEKKSPYLLPLTCRKKATTNFLRECAALQKNTSGKASISEPSYLLPPIRKSGMTKIVSVSPLIQKPDYRACENPYSLPTGRVFLAKRSVFVPLTRKPTSTNHLRPSHLERTGLPPVNHGSIHAAERRSPNKIAKQGQADFIPWR